MTFDQLFAFSEPKRVLRSKTVRGPNLGIDSWNQGMRYRFNFKAYPSTEHRRHKGYIEFKKPEDPDTPLEQCACVIDCDCKDFRYTWAWANTQRDASRIGDQSMNQCIDQAPRIKNPQAVPGLCKHLIALRNFLYGQDSRFPPTDDPQDPGDLDGMFDQSRQFYNNDRLANLTRRSSHTVIDDQGNPIGYLDDAGNPVITQQPETPATETPPPGSASAAHAARSSDQELARRTQIRTQGGDPDSPEAAGELPPTSELPNPVPPVREEPPATNPTNQPNPQNQPNQPNQPNQTPPRRSSNRRESIERTKEIFNNMDDLSEMRQTVQEMVDAASTDVNTMPGPDGPAGPAEPGMPSAEGEKTPSQQALDYLASMNGLLQQLVQLQGTPEAPPEEPMPSAEPAPEEEPQLPATPGAPPRPGAGAPPPGPRPGAARRPTPQF
jgi:hypothetical protein